MGGACSALCAVLVGCLVFMYCWWLSAADEWMGRRIFFSAATESIGAVSPALAVGVVFLPLLLLLWPGRLFLMEDDKGFCRRPV